MCCTAHAALGEIAIPHGQKRRLGSATTDASDGAILMKTTTLAALALLSFGIGLSSRYLHFDNNSAAPSLSCQSPALGMARLEMLFGRARPTGAPVTDAEWAQFLEAEVTPRFPQGLTVVQGFGQWRGSNGKLAREKSSILVIWHEFKRTTEADIEAIRSAYKQQFGQESVMRVESASCVSF